MEAIGRETRDWIASQTIEGCTTTKKDDDHYTFANEAACGSVNFYTIEDAPEIVELLVEDPKSGKATFFLHFELLDIARAKELFSEMSGVLAQAKVHTTSQVLLCCTVGMTTSMFAAKLDEAAKSLSLDYHFRAMALEDAKATGGDFVAVMLAPQVGYRRREVAESFPGSVVFEIPPKLFGSYDAGGALRVLLGLLGDKALSAPDFSDLNNARGVKNDKRVMIMAMVHRPTVSSLYWHVFDCEKCLACGEVSKPDIDENDFDDVLATLPLHGVDPSSLDAVGIAMPGATDHGEVRFGGHGIEGGNLAAWLSERHGTRVVMDNNANAAAVASYVKQEGYNTVVLHIQQVGYAGGGQGAVVEGRLVRGHHGFAGELQGFNVRLSELSGIEDRSNPDLVWSAEKMIPILANQLLAPISVIAPDAIYLSYDLVDDMDALRAELAKVVPEDQLPDLIHINDYLDRIFLGEMVLVLQRLATKG